MKKSFKQCLFSALMAGLLCVSMVPSAFAAAPAPDAAAISETAAPAATEMPADSETAGVSHTEEPQAPAGDPAAEETAEPAQIPAAPPAGAEDDPGFGLPGISIPVPTLEPGETPAPETEIERGQTDEVEPTATPEPTEAPTQTEEPATPETAEPEQNEIPPIILPDGLDMLYGDLPDKPTGSYMGSYGLPVATGDTKISLGIWNTELLDVDNTGHLDAAALDAGDSTVTVGRLTGQDYAIVPLLAQVEYPDNGSLLSVMLPDTVTVLSYASTSGDLIPADDAERIAIFQHSFSEVSAAATGFYVQASEDFTATISYTDAQDQTFTKTLTVQFDGETDVNPLPVPVNEGIALTATGGRPDPPYTTGKITSIAKENGSWLLWFNGEEAYCCTHGLNGQPKGCPPYTFSYTSILEPGQFIPGDHYGNQVRIWGALGQISLSMPDAAARYSEIATVSEESDDMAYYDETQQYIIRNYPESEAAKIYVSSAQAAKQRLAGHGTNAISGENGYYSFIFLPGISGWQTVAIPGPPIGDEPPEEVPPVPVEYYADWSAAPQSASGAFELNYTLAVDKHGLSTREKVDGATVEIEPVTKSGTIDGGNWAITPAEKQTVTTAGHKMDDTYHQTGGAASASWTVRYSVSKTSSGGRSGRVGPCSSQEEADSQAASARSSAENELRNEAQAAVNAALASARSQLATLNFTVNETVVPVGFDAVPGTHGSAQTVSASSGATTTAQIDNDEWELHICIDKIDAETGNRIEGAASFVIFEWDVVAGQYIPTGGYNQYKVERQADKTYKVVNHSDYANSGDTLYYTQRNLGRFLIVEQQAPSGYYGDWTDPAQPGEAGDVRGKRACYIEITKALDGQTIWLGDANYNADIGTADNGGTKLRTPKGDVVTVTISDTAKDAARTYATDPSGVAANEDSFTAAPKADKYQNTRVLGEIVLTKVDLDAMSHLAPGSNGVSTLEGAVYDLYAAADIKHPDGVTGVVDYSKITRDGAPIWHTTVLTNSGWDGNHLPVLKKDNLVASAAISDGKLAFANLYLGKYYLVERATGITLPVDSSGNFYLSGQYPEFDRKLQPTGQFAALKQNGSGEYTDYVYKNLYSAVAEGRALDGSKTYDGYYLSYASGYLCDEINHYQTLTYGNEAGYIVQSEQQSADEVLKSGFSLQKLVSTTGSPSPAPKLGGAGFTVYRIDLLSKAGEFTKGRDGVYDLQSVLDAYRNTSYDQDTAKYDFSSEAQAVATMYESDTAAVTAYNATLTAGGDFANGSGAGWQPTRNTNEYRLAEIFTNEEGVIRVTGLPYAQYLVVETTVPKDLFQADPFLLNINSAAPQSAFCSPQGTVTTASGSYMTFNILDEELEATLQIAKVDIETGKTVLLAGTTFSVYRVLPNGDLELVELTDPASSASKKKVSVFTTDETGTLRLPEKLPLGRYRIIELQGPAHYFNDESYHVDFEVTSDRVYQVEGGTYNDMDDLLIVEEYKNHETLGQITIRKSGEMLTGFEEGQFKYTMDQIDRVEFEIRAKDDVPTPDNQDTFWYKAGDLVATATTATDGQVDEVHFAPTRTTATYDFLTVSHDGTKGEVSITLPLGCFTVKETKAAYGFTISDDVYTVVLDSDNQRQDIVLAKSVDLNGDNTEYGIVTASGAGADEKEQRVLVFENQRTVSDSEPGHIGVGIYKQDIETREYLSGAVYELYTSDPIYDEDGELLAEADALLGTSTPTNEDGFGYFETDIPIRGELFATGEATPRSGAPDERYNSGNFYLVERVAPAGFLVDPKPLPVSFTYPGQEIYFEIVATTNANLTTKMNVSKRDITNGEELPGATLTVTDSDGNVVESWVSGTEPHLIEGLETGKSYVLTEKVAPDGFAPAESITFKVEQAVNEADELQQATVAYILSADGQWQPLDEATVVMYDSPAVTVKKTAGNGQMLPDAQLSVRDASGAVVDSWATSDYGHTLVALSAEDAAKDPRKNILILSDDTTETVYTLQEDVVPAGYQKAAPITFKVMLVDGKLALFPRSGDGWTKADTTVLTMVDVLVPTTTPTPTPTPTTPPDTPQPTPTSAPTPAPVPYKPFPQTGD